MTDKEVENLKQFMTKHKNCNTNTKSTKNKFVLEVTRNSGIGNAIFVKCKGCGKEENITDYRSW